MELATGKRSRRLLVVAAVIALSAAIFAAVQAPLRAQSPARIVITVDGKDYDITRGQLEQNTDREGPFTQRTARGGTTTVPTERAISLQKLLDVAGVPNPTRFVVLPQKGGGRFYAGRGDRIAFWFNSSQNGQQGFNWFREFAGGNDVNKPDEGIDLEEFEGHLGNELTVTLSADPEKVRAGESVDFKATVQKSVSGEELTYDWNFGDGNSTRTKTDSVSHEYDQKDEYPVSVVVTGDEDSRGEDAINLNVRKKAPASNSGSGGSSGGSGGSSGGSGGSSGGSGGSGGSSGGSGAIPPAGAAPYDPGTTPPNSSTPALPPPSASPPPSGIPGRGPNLDPSAPPAATSPSGESITGVLVSTSTPPKPGQSGGAKAPNAAQNKQKADEESIDWRLATGIALTALLLILGAVRERRPIRRLLPQTQ